MSTKRSLLVGAVLLGGVAVVIAQPFGRPPARRHTVTQAGELRLAPSTEAPLAASRVSIVVEGGQRVIRANGLPEHNTGRFPGRGNPNPISHGDCAKLGNMRPSRQAGVWNGSRCCLAAGGTWRDGHGRQGERADCGAFRGPHRPASA
ncbi:hypothetical protein [Pirellulimonas nuda]|uniref:hypothetical protein n=1 Tax=Pirellulimonas nuda TaxID=2528009 RepID=UPI0011A58686|nr:hypothetical protein [Pirellulimonas nuda]